MDPDPGDSAEWGGRASVPAAETAPAGSGPGLVAAVAAVRAAAAHLAVVAASGSARGEVDGDGLAALIAEVHAVGSTLDAAALALVGDLDARGGAGRGGAGRTAAELRSRLAVTSRAAAATVRLARSLHRGHTRTRAALAAAELSVEHARVVTDTLDALPDSVDARTRGEAEAALVDAARDLDPAQFAVLARRLSALLDPAGLAESLERAHAARRLTLSTTLDGVLHIHGHTDAVSGATLLTALDPLAAPAPAADGTPDPRTPDQRRADALITLAQLALDHPVGAVPARAGAPGDPAGGRTLPGASTVGAGAASRAGTCAGAGAGTAPVAGPDPRPVAASPLLPPGRTALGRPHLLLTVDVQALSAPGAPVGAVRAAAAAAYGRPLPATDGRDDTAAAARDDTATAGRDVPASTGAPPTLTWAGPLPPDDARRLACDASVTAVITAGRRVLDVGRTRRYVTPDLLRALIVRDGGGCAFPACTRPWTWCHAHHIRSWVDGGPTSLDNLLLLCSAHHRLIHSGAGAADWVIEFPAVPGAPPTVTRRPAPDRPNWWAPADTTRAEPDPTDRGDPPDPGPEPLGDRRAA